MAPSRTILVLWNAKARRGDVRAQAFLERLRVRGFSPLTPEGCDTPTSFGSILEAHGPRADVVAVCGGDGTLNCALPVLMRLDRPLLFVPSGTANNFARNQGLPADLDSLVALLEDPRTRRVDIAVANATPFLTVCGLGLSTLVNETVAGGAKRLLGPLAFAVQALRVAWNMRPFRVHLSFVDHEPLEVRNVYQVSVCNGRYFATGLSVTDDATMDDGRLDILCVHFRRWWYGLFFFAMFFRGTAHRLTDVTHVRTRGATLFSHRIHRLDVDGDVKERAPVTFRVRGGAVRVIRADGDQPL